MNAAEFIKKVQKVGRAEGVDVRFDKTRGRGSHGTLYYGERFTTVKDRKKEIGPGLLRSMKKDLGVEFK